MLGVRRVAETRILAAGWMSGVVTILGPPGVGKSRLAWEFAAQAPVPTVIARLGSTGSPHGIDAAVAEALGIGGVGDAEQVVPKALAAHGRVLVVLDGCEAAAGAVAARIERWRAGAPELAVLATSRVPLGSPDEVLVRLDPLGEPDATAMFVARARLVSPDFAPGPDLGPLLARLDHLPLAIELAASRVGVVSIRELTELVDRDVVGAASDEGLIAAVDGVRALLDPATRALLDELVVFEAPFALDAAAAVSGRTVGATLAGIQSLVECGLVRVFAAEHLGAPETRYAPYTFVRQRRRLSLRSDAPQFARHAAYYAAIGSRDGLVAVRLRPASRAALRLAAPELLAALARDGDPAHAVGCALAWMTLAMRQGPVAEAVALAERIGPQVPDADRARFGQIFAGLVKMYGDYRRGIAITDAALPHATDPVDLVGLRVTRFILFANLGDRAQRTAELEAAAPFADRSGVERPRYLVHAAYLRATRPEELRDWDEAARVAAQLGDREYEAIASCSIGRSLMYLCDWARAEEYFDRTFAACEADPGLGRVHATALAYHGALAARRGDLVRAVASFTAAVQRSDRIGSREVGTFSGIELALIRCARGELSEALAELRGVLAQCAPSDEVRRAMARGVVAEVHWMAGRDDEARSAAEQAFAALPSGHEPGTRLRASEVLAWLDAEAGAVERARERLAAVAGELAPIDHPRHTATRAAIEALAGRPAEARALLDDAVAAALRDLLVGSVELPRLRRA
ncbi:MAG: hypothetical protein ABMB14_36875, partial [Myxococcota bacterium]